MTGLPVVSRPAEFWGVVAWVGIFLIVVSTGFLFFEFGFKPLLSLAIDLATSLGIAAPH